MSNRICAESSSSQLQIWLNWSRYASRWSKLPGIRSELQAWGEKSCGSSLIHHKFTTNLQELLEYVDLYEPGIRSPFSSPNTLNQTNHQLYSKTSGPIRTPFPRIDPFEPSFPLHGVILQNVIPLRLQTAALLRRKDRCRPNGSRDGF